MKLLKTFLYILVPLGFALVTLKLTNLINWDWSIVLSPFWLPMAFFSFCLILIFVLLKLKMIEIELDLNIIWRDKDGES